MAAQRGRPPATDEPMTHGISTYLLVNYRLTGVWLERISAAGIPAVEIFCARQHFDYRDTAQIRELGHWFRDSELTLHSLHAPMYSDDSWGRTGPKAVVNIAETEKRRRIENVDEIKRTIEVAEYIPFRYLIQHLGMTDEEYHPRKVEAAFNSFEELTVFGRQRGVEVLVENTPNGLSSAERLAEFNAATHLELHYCFDVGHAHMAEGVENAFGIMAEGIRSTHIHDNNGIEDQHLFPSAGDGSIDWRRTMEILRSRPDQYPLLMELKEVPGSAAPVLMARDALHRLEEMPAPEDEARQGRE